MKIRRKNKKFPSLNVYSGRITPYVRKGVIRNYHYKDIKKLGQGVGDVRITTCTCHAYQT